MSDNYFSLYMDSQRIVLQHMLDSINELEGFGESESRRVSALEDVIYTHGGVGERPNTRMHANREDIDDLAGIIDNILVRLVEIESRSDGGTGGTGGGRTQHRRRKKRTRRRRKRKGKTRRKRRR